MQFTPFVRAFYAFESPMFYMHHNRESDVIVIFFAMGTHQGDPLGQALFALTHFKALHSIASDFLFYLFPSIVDDTHIIGSFFIVSFAYEHIQTKFHAVGLFIQPHKCVTWSPSGLLLDFNTPSQFTTS
jgi:hypothetical protein